MADKQDKSVAMPSRAFLFSPYADSVTVKDSPTFKSQCPRGHFCFLHTDAAGAYGRRPRDVAMPSRAFLFSPFGSLDMPDAYTSQKDVAMPSRAFLFSP